MERDFVYNTARRYQRFSGKPRSLALVGDENNNLPYHIVQIGKGGLSFRYLGKKLNYSAISKINLYYEEQLIVDSIPVKPIADFLIRDNYFVPVRCHCVCFKELASEQRQTLDNFIQNYTVA
jgi:hypothetical protein